MAKENIIPMKVLICLSMVIVFSKGKKLITLGKCFCNTFNLQAQKEIISQTD